MRREAGRLKMDISITREEHHYENRVALTPAGVKSLVGAGHNVFVERGAGDGAGFNDEEYIDVGATVVYSKDEAFIRGKIVLKIFPPTLEEYELLSDDQTIISFLHLVASRREGMQILLDRRITAIGLEVIEDRRGDLPVLSPMSELAGQMALPIASHYLSNIGGGRGILLGGGAGIPPATLVVLGAGIVGINAVRNARAIGCNVILLDASLDRLRRANELFNKQVVTYLPFKYNLEKVIPFADVLIGAVLIHGEKAPKLVTADMVGRMKPGSIIIDVSIDQGGCVETSRPTSWASPVYVEHGVTHFCVPNMPSNVGRTATYALSNAVLPYILDIAGRGLKEALLADPGLQKGVYTYNGRVTNRAVADKFEFDYLDLVEALKGDRA
jgi:alanine dehydrogenase